jgi:hypothetical protein
MLFRPSRLLHNSNIQPCHSGFVERRIPESFIFHSNANIEIPAFTPFSRNDGILVNLQHPAQQGKQSV